MKTVSSISCIFVFVVYLATSVKGVGRTPDYEDDYFYEYEDELAAEPKSTSVVPAVINPECEKAFEVDCTVDGNFPHPDFCECYAQCIEGVPSFKDCGDPYSTLFDVGEDANECNDGYKVHCGDRLRPPWAGEPPITPTTTPTTTLTPSTTVPTTSTSTAPTSTSTSTTTQGPTTSTSTTTLAPTTSTSEVPTSSTTEDPTSSTSEVPTSSTTEDPTSSTTTADYTSYSSSSVSPSISSSTFTPPTTIEPPVMITCTDRFACPPSPPETSMTFPHEKYCAWYYDCWNGHATCLSCPHSQVFKLNTEWDNGCVDPFNAEYEDEIDCTGKIPTYPCDDYETSNEAYYPDPTDCSYFFKCVNNSSEHFRCPEGLMYDAEWNICNDPDNVDCTVEVFYF